MDYLPLAVLVSAGLVQGSGASMIKYAASYRHGAEVRRTRFVALMGCAFLLFLGGVPIYTYGVSLTKLSTAQPVFSATIFLATTVASLLLFKERLTIPQVIGMLAIIGGILMVMS
ncbi:MAG: EamA family transporter [Chloroflexota bacterium]